MDLRPKLAREFAEAAFAIFQRDGIIGGFRTPVPSDEQVQRALDNATAAILKGFVSRSVRLPDGEWVGTQDEAACEAFLEKYPKLRDLITLAKAEASARWPEARFTYELHSDPEGCHTCCEGQRLVLQIHTSLAFYDEEGGHVGSPFDLAEDAWMDWTCGEGPWQDAIARIGKEAHLLSTDLLWAGDESGE